MKIRSLWILLCTGIFLVFLLDQFVAAKIIHQETRRANNGSPSGFALEITWDEKGKLYQTFSEVPGTGAANSVSAPTMVSGYAGRPSQLDFWFGVEGEAVRVTITQSYTDGPGVRFKTSEPERNARHLLEANSEPHVSYLLQADQKIEVNDFSEYGVKPFEIRIVRVKHVDPPLPSFSSCTDAIQLVNVERMEGEFPTFKFTLRNAGSRRISYLEGKLDTGGGLGTAGERPVAEAGEQFTLHLPTGFKGRVTGETYRPDTFASFRVTGVVFGDGDFAGDRQFAFDSLHCWICNRLTDESVVALFNERIESGATDLGELRSKILAMFKNVGVDETRQLAERFPEFARKPEMASCAQSFDSVSKGLLSRIDAFELDHSGATNKEVVDFLKSLRAPFQEKLSRWAPRSSN